MEYPVLTFPSPTSSTADHHDRDRPTLRRGPRWNGTQPTKSRRWDLSTHAGVAAPSQDRALLPVVAMDVLAARLIQILRQSHIRCHDLTDKDSDPTGVPGMDQCPAEDMAGTFHESHLACVPLVKESGPTGAAGTTETTNIVFLQFAIQFARRLLRHASGSLTEEIVFVAFLLIATLSVANLLYCSLVCQCSLATTIVHYEVPQHLCRLLACILFLIAVCSRQYPDSTDQQRRNHWPCRTVRKGSIGVPGYTLCTTADR